jgi:hypothetical protein
MLFDTAVSTIDGPMFSMNKALFEVPPTSKSLQMSLIDCKSNEIQPSKTKSPLPVFKELKDGTVVKEVQSVTSMEVTVFGRAGIDVMAVFSEKLKIFNDVPANGGITDEVNTVPEASKAINEDGNPGILPEVIRDVQPSISNDSKPGGKGPGIEVKKVSFTKLSVLRPLGNGDLDIDVNVINVPANTKVTLPVGMYGQVVIPPLDSHVILNHLSVSGTFDIVNGGTVGIGLTTINSTKFGI